MAQRRIMAVHCGPRTSATLLNASWPRAARLNPFTARSRAVSARFTPEQNSIRDTARTFLRESCDFAHLHRVIDGDAGWDTDLWKRFAGELGFAGLAIPETHGGSGLGALELSLVAEELGAVLAPIPWFETAVLAAGALVQDRK